LQTHGKRKRVIKGYDLSKTVSCSESELISRFGNVVNEPIGSNDELVHIWQLVQFKSDIVSNFAFNLSTSD